MISKNLLKDYAKLLTEKGLNVQKGQYVVVRCDVDQPEFVYMVVNEAYKLGAKKVFVDFEMQKIKALSYKKQSQKSLNFIEEFAVSKLKWTAETLPAILYLVSEDPFGFTSVKAEKLTKTRAAQYPVIKPFRKAMEGKYQWCIAAVPGKAWAKRIFPDLSAPKAVDALWNAILKAALVDGDAIGNWDKHNKFIKDKCDYLNSLHVKTLRYSSANGTDFSVELNKDGLFLGGMEKTLSGVTYNPNIPSYEIFTTPVAGRCEGTVVSTKPLSYQGKIINNFSITFENGEVKSVKAEQGEDLLKQLVALDDGSKKLGEVALVPFDNPINNSGILFYETLFDENACCHLALGQGFIETLKGYENMTDEEIRAAGVNDSMLHEDFMIGSADLKIVAETFDGKKITIFEKGNWAK